MATFYGTVQGRTSAATRCGTSISGIKTTAQSWNGSIYTEMHYWGRETDGTLLVHIALSDGSKSYADLSGTHWRGTFEQLRELLARDARENDRL